jgi:hypothetical protein
MPRDSQQQSAGSQGAGAGGDDAAPGGAPAAGNSAAADTRPGIGLGAPIDTPDPLQKYKWWILSGLALVLVIAAAFFLRGKPAQSPAEAPPVPSPLVPTSQAVAPERDSRSPLLSTLKDELFALETERLEGRISEGEYLELKSSLEVVLRRALARTASPV